jgi:hypothetical protein
MFHANSRVSRWIGMKLNSARAASCIFQQKLEYLKLAVAKLVNLDPDVLAALAALSEVHNPEAWSGSSQHAAFTESGGASVTTFMIRWQELEGKKDLAELKAREVLKYDWWETRCRRAGRAVWFWSAIQRLMVWEPIQLPAPNPELLKSAALIVACWALCCMLGPPRRK